MAEDSEIKPWDKQSGESSKRYSIFCRYRDMGPEERSLRKVAEEIAATKSTPGIHSKLRQLKRWSTEDNWVARCDAWDAEQERLFRIEHRKKLKEMAKRHVNIALTLQKKAADRLKQLNPELTPEDLTPEQALKYMESGVKLERLTLGEPDQVIEHKGEVKTEVSHDISNAILSDPEAADLACKLFKRIAVGKGDASGLGEAGK